MHLLDSRTVAKSLSHNTIRFSHGLLIISQIGTCANMHMCIQLITENTQDLCSEQILS